MGADILLRGPRRKTVPGQADPAKAKRDKGSWCAGQLKRVERARGEWSAVKMNRQVSTF